MINEDVAGEAARSAATRGVITGEAPKSVLFVPLLAGGQRDRRDLAPERRPRARVHGDRRAAAVTLAGSLSVALENARLVHETRQRNAELALINSVQEAIAGELDQQAIYDLVGDRVQEVFDAQVVVISMLDEASGLLVSPYLIERGERLEIDPMPADRLPQARDRDPRAADDQRGRGPARLSGTAIRRCWSARCRSLALFVPLFAGGRATGVISLQNVDREHAFTDADERLLSRSPAASASRSRTRASSTRPASGTPSSR